MSRPWLRSVLLVPLLLLPVPPLAYASGGEATPAEADDGPLLTGRNDSADRPADGDE